MQPGTNPFYAIDEEIENSNIQGASTFAFSNSLNTDYLSQVYGGDIEYAAEMFEIFIDTVPADIKELIKLMKVKYHSAIYQLAHKIKPTFAMVGLSYESELMEEIQQQGNDGIGDYEKHIPNVEKILSSRLSVIQADLERMQIALNR